jgi:hypothetical protein
VRQTPTQTVLPPSLLSKNFLQSISPSQSASPSVAQYSAGLAHDARNMLAAMDIYCELLGSPGVLKPEDKHLLDELRLLRDSSGKLLDRLLIEALKCLAATDQVQNRPRSHAAVSGTSSAPPSASHAAASPLDTSQHGTSQHGTPQHGTVDTPGRSLPAALIYDPADGYGAYDGTEAYPTITARAPRTVNGDSQPSVSVTTRTGGKRVSNLMAALQSNLPMLSALAGPRVHVSLELGSCPEGELFMPAVDLTRVLINLVRNAAEAMSIGGRILIAATSVSMPETDPATSRLPGEPPAAAAAVLISIEDNGPGIPLSLLDRIFDLQASSATAEESLRPRMQFRPRGLGLRIVRDFVEAGGGSVRALRLPDRGSRFEIVLPMVTVRVTQVRMEI